MKALSECLVLVVSYNRPNLNAFASWSANAITLASDVIVGSSPYGVFVNTDNVVYAVDETSSRIQIWENGSVYPTKTYVVNWGPPKSIFVSISGGIYLGSFWTDGIVRITTNGNSSIPVMSTDGKCIGVFVDIVDNLYCSVLDQHKVVKKSLNSLSNTTLIVAGTGCIGSTLNMLNTPHGIFVDTNLDLYVADTNNNRIQLFRPNELNAITMAGNGSLNVTITITYPLAVILDADKYLFITDQGGSRIVGSGPNGFRCIVGCFGSGSASNQLRGPQSISFDSAGNIFVTDGWWVGGPSNNRIQKFILLTNTLGKCRRKLFTIIFLVEVSEL